MKLERFKEKKQKKIGMIMGITSIVLLLAVVIVYRTYSIYQESQEFDVIKGSVPDQNYDVMFAFYLVEEDGMKKRIETVPETKNYQIDVECNQKANGTWDEEKWGPVITNLTNARTKCNIIFKKLYGPLKDYGIIGNAVTEGSGLYQITHENASITYTTNTTAIANLKKTEYRYAGSSPNNYVTFNGEVAGWRIIGLVNIAEGQRLKLIRDESIGDYSWDTSASNINSGRGINEWSQASLKVLLNNDAYYNRTAGKCGSGHNNSTVDCDFSETGLTNEAKNMMDTVTWNTAIASVGYNQINTLQFYNYERSKGTGKVCSGTGCNDSVARTVSWKGQVGVIYPSDYGYATSGGKSMNRITCLNKQIYDWQNTDAADCYLNNWLYKGSFQWTLTPYASSVASSLVFRLGSGVTNPYASAVCHVYPSIYLKANVKIKSGSGTKEHPFELGNIS